jgi:TolB-like protein
VADIFVSYARVDKPRVAPLVAALEAQGWSVWWDPAIVPGEAFDDLIAAEIDRARAVIVVWTPTSTASRWVRGEAREAADRGILVPVRLDHARLPIDARALHTTDLDDWGEDAESAPFRALIAALSRLLKDATPTAAKVEHQSSICVLPFSNMSGDPEQEYFSDGISEDIITDLSKVAALLVIARNTAFTFKGKAADVKAIARQLGVRHVLEGSVRKSGTRVRITAQLIDAASGGHLWAERYDRELNDIFALQDEISQAIVAALRLKLLPEEKKAIEDRGTASVEAYDKYLRAQALASQGMPADSDRAEALFREALAIDPGFARARAGLWMVYLYGHNFAPERVEGTLRRMDSIVKEALAHAPDHWATHLVSGAWLTQCRDWVGADGAFRKTKVRAPPSDSLSSFYSGYFLTTVGRTAEAAAEFIQSRTADPLSLLVSQQLQQILYVLDRTDEAQAEYERTLGLAGNREPAEHVALMWIWDTGDLERTGTQFHRFLDNQAVPMPVLHQVLRLLDQPSAALERIRQAFDDSAYQDATRMMILSWYAARLGDAPLAVAAMRRAYVDSNGTYLGAMWFPFLREARKLAAFKTLIRDLRIYDYWRRSGKWGDFARPLGDDDFEIIR